jgi:hypothetical protein
MKKLCSLSLELERILSSCGRHSWLLSDVWLAAGRFLKGNTASWKLYFIKNEAGFDDCHGVNCPEASIPILGWETVKT